MNIVQKIKTLIKEAELFHKQGLLNEAMEKYDRVNELIQSNEQLKNSQSLVGGVAKKIGALKKDLQKVESATDSPEVPEKVQDLIKKMFAFSEGQDEDKTVLDGAIALAKFGQFDRALKEFNELLKKDALRIVAAKNIMRCQLEISSADGVISQYEAWCSGDLFSAVQLEKLRIFSNGILAKEGTDKTISKEREPAAAKEPEIGGLELEIEGLEMQEEEEEILDINSVGITLPSGPKKGEMVEIDVSFQSGNVVSLLISSQDKDVLEGFRLGSTIEDVQFFSPIAMFNGTGVVEGKTKIESGPRQGDFSIDIKVIST